MSSEKHGEAAHGRSPTSPLLKAAFLRCVLLHPPSSSAVLSASGGGCAGAAWKKSPRGLLTAESDRITRRFCFPNNSVALNSTPPKMPSIFSASHPHNVSDHYARGLSLMWVFARAFSHLHLSQNDVCWGFLHIFCLVTRVNRSVSVVETGVKKRTNSCC